MPPQPKPQTAIAHEAALVVNIARQGDATHNPAVSKSVGTVILSLRKYYWPAVMHDEVLLEKKRECVDQLRALQVTDLFTPAELASHEESKLALKEGMEKRLPDVVQFIVDKLDELDNVYDVVKLDQQDESGQFQEVDYCFPLREVLPFILN